MPEDVGGGGPRYWAFISYSHKDAAFGRRLHRSLENYVLPRRLAGRAVAGGTVPKRLAPIFRDREELPAAGDLSAGASNVRVTVSARSLVRSTMVSCLVVLSFMPLCSIEFFLPVELSDDLVQRFETLVPDVPITIEPFVKLLEGLSAQSVEPLLCAGLHLDQTHSLENFQVLRSLRLPEPETDMDVVHGARPLLKQFDDPQAIGLA